MAGREALVVKPAGDGGLSHVDEHGRASMVNVIAKVPTQRVARAACQVRVSEAGRDLLEDPLAGPDILSAARAAGLVVGKRAAAVIPLCHPIRIDSIAVEVAVRGSVVSITATAETVERTGVEMEALTACAGAALTIVGSVLAADPSVRVDDLQLLHKSGGRSGTWDR
jgi:cyclic pyranopterin phosphate synthase